MPRNKDPSVPETVGAYRILAPIGQGGMGRVYLAERSDGQFEHQVAVKFVDRIRSGLELFERFRAERQILASLEHPYIARLTDGGETNAGAPYLVMEYIDGVPIDQYCDTHQLGIADRLTLFAKVCAAVEYAHRNLVIHRDIKPSNILVTVEGVPKLLDFGIAMLLPEDSSDYAVAPQGEDRLMTPRNASPEQLRGDTVTTATDVYALGLLLYELLTGRFPYDASAKGDYALEQQISAAEPTRPSDIVASSAGAPAETASRGLSDGQLKNQLEGDLDNIVLMAMRKEPERRYATVGQLADDVAAFLEHRPVLARGDSLRYRMGKFVRRNPGGVGLVVASTLVAVSLIGIYTYRLGVERDRAELEAAKAGEVAAFMTGLFREADPRQRGSEPMSIVDMLGRGAERVQSDLVDQPELQASLVATIGQSYHNMYELSRAREYLEGVLPALEDELGADHQDVLRGRYVLGMSTSFLGDTQQALDIHRQNHAVLVERFGRRSPEAATELHQIGFIRSVLGEYDEAETDFLEVIATFRGLGEPGRQGLSTGLMEYGSLLSKLGREEENLIATRESLALREALHGRNSPDYADVLNNLANSYWLLNRYDEAGALMQENMELRREIYGDTSIPYGVAVFNYAGFMNSSGRYEEALEYFDIALPIYRERYGADHRRYAYAQENLAGNYEALGDFEQAERYFLAAMDILVAQFGDDHLEVAITRSRYGSLLIQLERLDEALQQLEPTLRTMRDAFGEVNRRTASARRQLGRAYHALGRNDEALNVVQVGIDAMTPPPEQLRRNFVTLQNDKAAILAETGDFDAAVSAIEAAIAVWNEVGVTEFPRWVFLDATYADVLARSGDRDAAVAHLLEREAFFKGEFGDDFEHMHLIHDALRDLGVER